MQKNKYSTLVVKQGRMHWLNIIVMALLTGFAIVFALSNLFAVEVSFLGVTSTPVPLYVPVFIAFLVGFSGGMLSLSFSRRKHKERILKLNEENALLQQEVENLRNIPLQDDV
jgi:uncharacterized integral membrane protein